MYGANNSAAFRSARQRADAIVSDACIQSLSHYNTKTKEIVSDHTGAHEDAHEAIDLDPAFARARSRAMAIVAGDPGRCRSQFTGSL